MKSVFVILVILFFSRSLWEKKKPAFRHYSQHPKFHWQKASPSAEHLSAAQIVQTNVSIKISKSKSSILMHFASSEAKVSSIFIFSTVIATCFSLSRLKSCKRLNIFKDPIGLTELKQSTLCQNEDQALGLFKTQLRLICCRNTGYTALENILT